MRADRTLWEPGSAGRMEAEGLPAVVADEGDPPGRLRRHSPDKSGSHNRWGGSAGRLAADWTLWEAGSAGRMGPDLVLWEPGSAGRMEAEGLPAVVADEGDPPGRLRRHSPDKSGSHNRWGGSAGRLAADWTLWEAGSAGRMEAEGLPAVLLALAHAARSPSVSIRSGNPSSHREPFGLHSLGEPELPQGGRSESRWIASGQARPGCQGARCPV